MTEHDAPSGSALSDDAATHDARPGGAVSGGGAPLLEAVAIMDRLRSPGGCPWDREQTHASLMRYLIEECYELLQAIEDGDVDAMREELGDVLLQVLFHSRIAAETPSGAGGFDIDDVARGLVDKLIRRHPYVFGGPEERENLTPDEQQVRWDELKKAEHAAPSPLDGVAVGQPAIALAAKLGARSVKYGVSAVDAPLPAGDSAGERIFRLAFEAGARGDDPEQAVRAAARSYMSRVAGATAKSARDTAADSALD
jgi:XTP/dITP diphosphohydrolase